MRAVLVLRSPAGVALHQGRLPSLPLIPPMSAADLIEILLQDLVGAVHWIQPRLISDDAVGDPPAMVYEAYVFETISYIEWVGPDHDFTPWERFCIDTVLTRTP